MKRAQIKTIAFALVASFLLCFALSLATHEAAFAKVWSKSPFDWIMAKRLSVDTTSTLTGDVTAAGDVTLTAGDLMLSAGDFAVGGDFDLIGDFEISTGDFTVVTGDITSGSGDLNAGDDLDVADDASIGGILTVDGRATTADGVESGTARVIGGRAYSNVAVSTTPDVSGSHAEAAFDVDYTIPASTIKAGSVIKISGMGTVIDQNASDTLTVAVKIGAETLLVSTAVTVADNDVFVFECTAFAYAVPGGAVPLTAWGTINMDATGTVSGFQQGKTTGNLATNGALDVTITHDWSASHADNDARLDALFVEII